MHKPFLVIAGNIASGKSTVAKRLADELGLPVYQEPADANPYLEGFYKDMSRYAFRSQLFFLAKGLNQHRQIEARSGGAVLDRSLYEHYLVFAHQLHADGKITDNDFAVLSDLYYGFQDLLASPDLLVMLEASTDQLALRLAGRGATDASIDPLYLQALQQRYSEFVDGWVACPVLKIDTEQLDPRSEVGLDQLVDLVLERLSLSELS